MPSEREFRFVRWYDPNKLFAVFEVTDLKQYFLVPRSRLIPHPLCQYSLEAKGIRDPNLIAEICAEQGSVFGIAIFRHWLHCVKTGKVAKDPSALVPDEEDYEKAYPFPPNVDFSCVRDCLLRGEDTDICIAECSSW